MADVTAASDQEHAVDDGPTSTETLMAGPLSPYSEGSAPPPSGPSLDFSKPGDSQYINIV